MPENKPVIGLSWEPKLPQLSFGTKKSSSNKEAETSAVYKPSSELIDGLFVPPNDPKKVNKFLRKQVKDTAGKNWYISNFSSSNFYSYYHEFVPFYKNY